MVYSHWCFLLVAVCFQVVVGDYVGEVKLTFNGFAVLEGESFRMVCEATHETQAPLVQWYRVNYGGNRINVTANFRARNSGMQDVLVIPRATLDLSGDFFCTAKVGLDEKTSNAGPIQVLRAQGIPRVNVVRSYSRGRTVLICNVVPLGDGDLTWLHRGYAVKHAKRVNTLEIMPKTRDRYQCFGNLTLARYKYFQSSAYITAGAGWSYMAAQGTFLSTVLMCVFTFFNV